VKKGLYITKRLFPNGQIQIYISIVILIASLFLLFNRIFSPQPIQITLESGQEITTSTPEYFSLAEVLLLVSCSFLIGSTAIYLYYNSDKSNENQHKTIVKSEKKIEFDDIDDKVLNLLKPEEKKVILILKENNGEILQNKLVLKLMISKVKVTRILHRLQQKQLITREKYGLTNLVKLKKDN